MKKILAILPALLIFSPMKVFASSGANDAVVDILNNGRYEGAINSIKGITEIVDVGFTMFITFIAFFIISAAMLRNVLAGAYCAYPKFWDKVDAAHKEVADTGWVTRLQNLRSTYQNINMGSLGKSMLRILPNIKTLTDFEEEAIEPKSYFIKAIPQMIGVVIIGVTIYNGYYRDVAAMVSNAGSVMFQRIILSTDPVAIFDRIAGTTGRPEFSTDNAMDDKDKLVNKVTKEAYGKVISTYSDVTGASAKSALATALEAKISDSISNKCAEYAQDRDTWKPSYDVSLNMGKSNMKDSKTTDGLGFSFVLDDIAISTLALDSTKEVGADWHLTIVINFRKQAPDSKTVTVTDLTMTVTSIVKNKLTITFPTGTSSHLVVYNSTTIDGKKVEFNASTGALTFQSGAELANGSWNCVGLGYKGSNGKTHQITSIKFTKGGASSFSAKLSSKAYKTGTIEYGSDIPDNLEKN